MIMELTFFDNFWIILALIYTIWLFSWSKGYLGSTPLAILFSVIVVYLAFFLNPIFVWVPVLLFIIAFFGVGLFDKIPEGKRKPDYLRD